ncbi:MAG: hypothetical protein AAGF11_31740 [Myxococcota bacterium]
MFALIGCLLSASMVQPSDDPRTIAPAANRPEIVAPGGSPAKAKTPKVRPPKGSRPTTVPPPPTDLQADPQTEPQTDPDTKTKRPRGRRRARTQDPPVDPETDDSTSKCFPAHATCWALGVAGIATASVGVGMIGSGVGFMLAPQYPVPDEPTTNRSLRRPGVALVTVGAIAVVAGTLSIVVGQIVHRRSQSRMARIQLTPGGLRW